MQHSEGTFVSEGVGSVFYQYWVPEQPRAVVLLVHGAGEHSGRYQRLAEKLCSHNYAVAGLDHVGHGKTDGTRVYVKRFEDYTQTLRVFHRKVAEDFPALPVIMLGHSLGGLITSHYLLQHQGELAACILSGPAVMTELEPGFFQTLVIRLLSAIAPKAGVLQLDASGVSRDPEEVQRYVDDPLVHNGKMTARMLSELFGAMQKIQADAARIEIPLLLLHGGADAMTAPQGSRFLYEHINSDNKQLKIYPGLYHEIFNEPEREAVFGDVIEWCDSIVAELGNKFP
jgi:acylglycerol lipase